MGDRGRVLVVEDDESIRRLLAEVLGINGYEVVEVADGTSAHPAAAEHRPDAILLDIGLPGIDGFGVLELLKGDAELRDIPVLMVTAWAEPALVRRALDRGAHDYVRKPFDLADLAARVDAALSGSRPGESGERPAALAAIADRVESARAEGPGFSLLLLEAEDYEGIVGTHGEAAAEGVLAALGRRLEQRGTVARWDSAAFALLADAPDGDAAAALAEELRASLASAPLATAEAAVRLSVRIATATWDGEGAEELAARCGAALAGDTVPVAA